MQTHVQIDSVLKRARAYWFVDGFTEMAAGVFFILLAGILLLQGNVFQASNPSHVLSVVGIISLVKLVGFLVIVLILWWLKDHFTYPRTGFVRGNRLTAAQVLTLLRNAILFLLLPIFGLLIVSVLLATVGGILSSMPVWFPIGVGTIWAALCILAGEWTGVSRFRVLGILFLLAGLAVGIWQWTAGLPVLSALDQPAVQEVVNRGLNGLGVLVLISGLPLVVSGLVTFLRYRKANPAPYAEES
jgi:hypothetical protein